MAKYAVKGLGALNGVTYSGDNAGDLLDTFSRVNCNGHGLQTDTQYLDTAYDDGPIRYRDTVSGKWVAELKENDI